MNESNIIRLAGQRVLDNGIDPEALEQDLIRYPDVYFLCRAFLAGETQCPLYCITVDTYEGPPDAEEEDVCYLLIGKTAQERSPEVQKLYDRANRKALNALRQHVKYRRVLPNPGILLDYRGDELHIQETDCPFDDTPRYHEIYRAYQHWFDRYVEREERKYQRYKKEGYYDIF